jgi:hypothetical protein
MNSVMNFRFLLLALPGPVFAAVVGCSSSAQSPREAFVDQFCTLFEPCCAAGKLSTDPQMCKSWSLWQGPVYDADAGNACLSAMQQAQRGGTLCPALPDVCGQVFSLAYDTVPPGGSCKKNTDCDPGDGRVPPTCNMTSTSADGGVTGTCIQMSKGKAGDGPCFVQYAGALTGASWPSSPPAHALVCDEAEGVWCDFTTNLCKPFAKVGDVCDWTANAPQCGPDATCNEGVPPRCVARLGAGAACDPLAFTCGAGLYCDPGTSQCTPMTALGGACTTGVQCAGECINGTCVSAAQAWVCGTE